MWLNSSDHRITTLHWITSSSSVLFLARARWMLFLQLARALSLHLCVVFLLPGMHRELNVIHSDCAGKSRQPACIWNSQVGYPHSLHRVCGSVYLSFFTVYVPLLTRC